MYAIVARIRATTMNLTFRTPTRHPMQSSYFTHACETCQHWPRGPMDKASAYGAGDCRFESCRGHYLLSARQVWCCSFATLTHAVAFVSLSYDGKTQWMQRNANCTFILIYIHTYIYIYMYVCRHAWFYIVIVACCCCAVTDTC